MLIATETSQKSRHFQDDDSSESLRRKMEDWKCITSQNTHVVVNFHVQERADVKLSFHEIVKNIADELCGKYPNISTYESIFNGKPHLKGTRFTVADVISAICIHGGDFEKVLNHYENRYTREQFNDALRYARDYLLETLDK